MADEDVRVPAGWYPDPLGLPQLRWWDNHAWTEHTSDARQPMVARETTTTRLAYADDDEPDGADAVGATQTGGARGAAAASAGFADPVLPLEAPLRDELTVDEPSPARRMAAAGLAADAPTSTPYNLDTRFDDLLGEAAQPRTAYSHLGDQAAQYIPDAEQQAQYTRGQRPRSQEPGPEKTGHAGETRTARRASTARPDTRARRGAHSTHADAPDRANTGPAWVIALLPIAVLMLGLIFLLSGFAGAASTGFGVFLLVVPYLVTVALAYVDRRQLLALGYESPAHWAWAFLTAPVYLAVRMSAVVRESGRGFGPMLTWATLAVLTAAAVVAVPGLVISLAPAAFADSVEQSVREDAAALGGDLRVECPAVPPLLLQQGFDCDAWTARDQPFEVTVSLQRANGWIDWRVDDWGITTVGTLGG